MAIWTSQPRETQKETDMSKTDDLFEKITSQIVATIESGNEGRWTKPWTTVIGASGLGINAQTQKAYQGFNQFVLMVETAVENYEQNVWATYKQFQALGGQVRKGEKGTQLVKWGKTFTCENCDHRSSKFECKRPGHVPSAFVWASAFTVFNVAQQDGFELPVIDLGTGPERIANVEAFIEATGAVIEHKLSNDAFFSPALDTITLPLPEQFDTVEGYYGTALHELTHWAGHKTRLDRQSGKVFGDQAYAAEELVAELGATFLAARFGIEIEPAEEHVAYLAGWLKSLKADGKALYRAAKAAQDSTEYLLGLAAGEVEETEEVAA
jgi:antirestriction protein ArdC